MQVNQSQEMIEKRIFYCIFSFLFFQGILAQISTDSLFLDFNLKFGKLPLQANKMYISDNQDTLQISSFKYYISNIEIHYSDKITIKAENGYHLVDLEAVNSFQIYVGKKTDKIITKVSFNIGVDSLASVSGALSGDLDPTKGMYWAWQSGYINMKLEGTSSSCKTRKNEFHFHIGGYLYPNYAMKSVLLETKNGKSNLEIVVDLSKIFATIDLSKSNSIMIPGKKAMEIAAASVSMFYIE